MAYIDTPTGLGQSPTVTRAKVFGSPTLTMEETRQSVDLAVEANIPGASFAEKILAPLELVEKVKREGTLVRKTYPPSPLTPEGASLPLPRPADQIVKPPIKEAVVPRIVNQPTFQPILDIPPEPTPPVVVSRETPAPLKPKMPSGASPDTVSPRLIETTDPDRPIAIAEPLPPDYWVQAKNVRALTTKKSLPVTAVEPVYEKPPSMTLPNYQPGYPELLRIEPVQIQTPAEAAGETFVTAAGLPSWAVPALIGAGLYILFGSAGNNKRRIRRRRR